MQTNHHYSSRFGIVRRLRFFFLAIIFILLSALVIGLTQVRSLDRSAKSLTGESVPVFIVAAELERNLKNLLVLLQEIESTQDLGSLDELQRNVIAQLDKLRDETQTPQDLLTIAQTAMATSLTDIAAKSTRVLDSKRALLNHKEAVELQVAKILNIQTRTRSQLEILALEVASASQVDFKQTTDDETFSKTSIEQRYHQNLIRANAVTELTLELDSIIEMAIGLDNLQQFEAIEIVERSLRFKMKNVVLLIGQMPQIPVRVSIAREIALLRGLIFDEDALLDEAKRGVIEYENFGRYSFDQIVPIQAISDQTRALTQTAQAQVRDSGRDLERSATRLVAVLIVTGAVAGLTILCAIVFLVERQINKRMARLTRAVLDIASGQTDIQVDVGGNDELGKMAKALEVFKTNAEELHRSNTELEKFAYVAAHDLRSPLRAIQDLSEWVVDDPETTFSDDGQEYMGLLRLRIERLNKLLSDLLEYSRVGKENGDISMVSVPVLVKETAEMLDPDGAYQISYAGISTPVTTFATPLRHILLNLINNAITHHDRPSGKITVSAEVAHGRLLCRVQDDGPGISPQYHERIFQLFQTLRSRDEVEGSGLGLAIIHKTLEHHEGAIHVASDPGLQRGTTFIFDLPEKTPTVVPLNKAA